MHPLTLPAPRQSDDPRTDLSPASVRRIIERRRQALGRFESSSLRVPSQVAAPLTFQEWSALDRDERAAHLDDYAERAVLQAVAAVLSKRERDRGAESSSIEA